VALLPLPPGAFTSLLNNEKFTIPNESRIKWLFGDEHCRKIMLPHSASPTEEDRKDCHIHDLFWKMQITYLCHQICQRINAIFNLSPLGQATSAEFHLSSRMQKLLLLLSNVRDKVTTWKDASTASSHHSVSLCRKLNEYIILVGEFALDEDSDSSNSPMPKSLVESIIVWARGQFSMQITLEDASPVQPRRDVAKALNLPTPDSIFDGPLSHASHIAFQVFQSRVMTLANWHEKYFDIVAGQDGQEVGVNSNEAAFFFAVHELAHCGFVRRLMTGRRKEDAYEKVALIWGNGR
jgi:hypothetical protein